MPQPVSALGANPLINALVLGEAKVGKTVSCIKSAVTAFGESQSTSGYVICCSSREHLRTAQLECPEGWEFDIVKSQEQMEEAIKAARKGVKEGRYKWIILDDFTLFAMAMEEYFVAAAKGNKYTAYQQLRQYLMNVVLRLQDCKVHFACTMHYHEVSDGEIDGQLSKKGKGIVPLLPGQSRELIPTIFNQVIWMQKVKSGDRVFCLNPEGVWGPGSHGLKDGTREIPADLGLLAEALKKAGT